MLYTESGYSFSNAPWFVLIERQGSAFGDGAKSTAAGTNVSKQHEGRRAMVPAFADVRALRRLADGVQSQPAGQFLELMKVFADGSFSAEPRRFGLFDWRANVDLYELRGNAHVVPFYRSSRLPASIITGAIVRPRAVISPVRFCNELFPPCRSLDGLRRGRSPTDRQ